MNKKMNIELVSFIGLVISLGLLSLLYFNSIDFLQNKLGGGLVQGKEIAERGEYTFIGNITKAVQSKDAKGFVFMTDKNESYVVNSALYYGSRLSTKIFEADAGYFCLDTPKGIQCYKGSKVVSER